MKSSIFSFILFLGLACSADSEKVMESDKFSSQADSVGVEKVQVLEPPEPKLIEIPYIEDEKPLFILIDTLNFDSQVEDIVQGDSFVSITIPNEEIDGYTASSYSFNGDEIWSIDFDSTEFINLAGNEFSSFTLIRFPIPWEDSYKTWLRDCKELYVNELGELTFEYIRPCLDITITNSDRFALYGTKKFREEVYSILDLEQDSIVYPRKYIVGNVLSNSKLAGFRKSDSIAFVDIHNLENDSLALRSILDINVPILSDSTLNVRFHTLKQSENILEIRGSHQTKLTPSNIDRYVLDTNRSLNQRVNEHSFVIFKNMKLGFVSYFESEIGIEDVDILSDSTAFIMQTIPKERGPNRTYNHNLLYYNFKNETLIWNSEKIVDWRADNYRFFPNYKSNDYFLVHYSGSISSDPMPCKTNIKLINLTNQDVICPPLFKNYELMFRPKLFQNPSDFNQFILHNSLGDKLIFARKND